MRVARERAVCVSRALGERESSTGSARGAADSDRPRERARSGTRFALLGLPVEPRWTRPLVVGVSRGGRLRRHGDVPGVALADGTLVVSTGVTGIARSRDGCGWSAWHPDFPAFFVDLRSGARDAARLFALSSTAEGAGFATQLWTSTDGGESWLPHGETLPADLAATSFAMSRSDGSRLYVAGSGANGAELLRSDDAGASWNRFTIEHAGVPRLVDVGAASQDLVVVLLNWHQHDEPGSALTDSIHISLDAGEHFGSLYTGSGDLSAASSRKMDGSRSAVATMASGSPTSHTAVVRSGASCRRNCSYSHSPGPARGSMPESARRPASFR